MNFTSNGLKIWQGIKNELILYLDKHNPKLADKLSGIIPADRIKRDYYLSRGDQKSVKMQGVNSGE